MANVNVKMSNMKFVDANGDVATAQIRDTNASHYLGRLNSDEAPTTASITLATGVTVTAKNNDWINLQTKADSYIWNGSTWVQFGGQDGTDATITSVSATVDANTGTPSISGSITVQIVGW